jgi:hypothetical protein
MRLSEFLAMVEERDLTFNGHAAGIGSAHRSEAVLGIG